MDERVKWGKPILGGGIRQLNAPPSHAKYPFHNFYPLIFKMWDGGVWDRRELRRDQGGRLPQVSRGGGELFATFMWKTI